MKLISIENLTQFYDKLLTVFSKSDHKHTNEDLSGVVDNIEIDGYKITFTSNGEVIKVIDLPKEYNVTLTSRTIVPTTSNQYISSKTLITGTQTIQGDTNLVPQKILRGANNIRNSIFGVYGIVDSIRRIAGYTGGSSYYGYQVADVARSYHLARINGDASFKYSQNHNYFTGEITDENGDCLLDCSSFIGLILRGVEYKDSPFNGATGTKNKTFSKLSIPDMYKSSPYVWADAYLDRQLDSSYRDIGYTGYYSIRRASDIAEYFYSKGCTLYEYSISPTSIPKGLMPGDLLFWSKDSANENQKSRFKAISHVGIVARDTNYYFQVTGYEDSKGDTVFHTTLSDHLAELTLVVRPNYNPIIVSITPLNTNLLPSYYYDSLKVDENTVINNVVFSTDNEGGLNVEGKASSGTTFYIYDKDNSIILEPGTYKLSGTPVHPQVSTSSNSTSWVIGIKDTSGNVITYDRGAGSTFTINSKTSVYVYIYISASLTSTDTFKFNPKLIRVN